MSSMALEQDREIVMSRVVAAPRELVFEVWSRPEHLDQWYGPNGFITKTTSFDFHPGGDWIYTMTSADGVVYPNWVRYERIEHPSLITYKHGATVGDTDAFDVTVTFEEQDGKTTVTMRSLFPTAEARDYVVREVGAIELGQQTLAKLDALASGIQQIRGTVWTLPADDTIMAARVFDAPRALVYKAWTDPEMVKQWWGPHHFTTPKVNIELRRGGRFNYVMRGPDGAEYPNRAEYVDIVPNEKLAYIDNFDMPNPPVKDLHVTVLFEDFGGKTRVSVITKLSSKQDRDTILSMGSSEGWSQQMEKLEAFLKSDT